MKAAVALLCLLCLLCLLACAAANALQDDPFIHNGQKARLGQFPWMVMFGGCTGAIVNKRTVITAAHCVRRGPPAWIFVARTDDATPGSRIPVAEAIPYPDYPSGPSCPTMASCDLAVLKTAKDIEFNSNVQPIRFWLHAEPAVGTRVLIMGYGRDGAGGRYGTLRYASNEITKRGCVPGAICTDQRLNGQRPGDSGGPVVYPRGNARYLLAVCAITTATTARNANIARYFQSFIRRHL